MTHSVKEPAFLIKIRQSIKWVGSTREDKESFMAGALAMHRLVLEHYLATPMLNPSLVGQQRAESTKEYYEQKIAALEERVRSARRARDQAKEQFLNGEGVQALHKANEKLKRQLTTAKNELKTLRVPVPVEPKAPKMPKAEKKRLEFQLDQCQHLLGKAIARIKELEQQSTEPVTV
jgi:hypothetical protein